MTTLEALEQQALDNDIHLLTRKLPCKGLYYAYPEDGLYTITLSSGLDTDCERCTVLAEELGHHHTAPVDLFLSSRCVQSACERSAAAWAVNALLPPEKLIRAWRAGAQDPWELAEYCDVTHQFAVRAMELYAERYNDGIILDGYLITFDLLHIREVV